MKIALYILGALITLMALIAIIGALLPRSHSVTRQAVYRQKSSTLYAVIGDWSTQPSWRSGLLAVEMLPPQDGHVRYREESKRGSITFTVIENVPGKRLVTKIDDLNLPYGGTWTFEFSDSSEGGCVRITEQGEVKNVFFRFFARFIFGYASSMETYLRDLGNKFGETVNPRE